VCPPTNRRGSLAAAVATVPAGRRSNASAPDGGETTTIPGDGTDTDPDGSPGDGPESTECPPFVEDVDRTVCHDDRGNAPLSLGPSETRFVEDDTDEEPATGTFTPPNERGPVPVHSPRQDGRAPYRRRGDARPRAEVPRAAGIPPGERHERVLSAEDRASPTAGDAMAVTVGPESAGGHAVRGHGSLDAGDDGRIERVARFRYLRAGRRRRRLSRRSPRAYDCVAPPSTTSVSPVTNEEASLERYATASPSSAGSPIRPSGMPSPRASRAASRESYSPRSYD